MYTNVSQNMNVLYNDINNAFKNSLIKELYNEEYSSITYVVSKGMTKPYPTEEVRMDEDGLKSYITKMTNLKYNIYVFLEIDGLLREFIGYVHNSFFFHESTITPWPTRSIIELSSLRRVPKETAYEIYNNSIIKDKLTRFLS
jgi:hypothetical protein